MKAMEYVDRYVYAVTSKLPERQRADIDKELRGLIEDMLDERVRDGGMTEENVEEVLRELGSPSELAEQYRDRKRYLVSPGMFPFYATVLKIVLWSIGIAMTVVFVIESLIDPARILDHFVGYLASLISTLVQGFAWVTVSFALIEYAGVKAEKLGIADSKRWSPSMLAAVPDPAARIRRSDPIAGLVFTVLLALLLTFFPRLLGIHIATGEGAVKFVSFFNEAVFRSYLPFVLGVLALGLLRDILKLVIGKWTIRLALAHIALNVVGFVLALVMFSDGAIWNPNFMDELVRSGVMTAGGEGYRTVSRIWEGATGILIYLIGAGPLVESVQVGVKAYRVRNQ